MTDEQKYNELLKELADVIKQKNDTISFQNYKIEGLKEQLAFIESEMEKLTGNEVNEK